MIEARPVVVIASVILDEIVLADGTCQPAVLGRAGIYSAIGARCWWPNVAAACAIQGYGAARSIDRALLGEFSQAALLSDVGVVA